MDLNRVAANRQADIELQHLEARQRVANELSQGNLQARLIESLPLVAEKLPKPDEIRTIAIGNGTAGHGLASFVAQVMAVLDGFRSNGLTREAPSDATRSS